MKNTTLTFWCLALIHALSGWLAGWFSATSPGDVWEIVFIGLLFSQFVLLGIWGALAKYRLPTRLLGVAFGIAYFTTQNSFLNGGATSTNLIFVLIPTAVVAGIMHVVRKHIATLVYPGMAISVTNGKKRPQFSIRHLLLLTLCVSFLLATGKWLAPFLSDTQEPLIEVAFFGLLPSLVGTGSVWAMLCEGRVIIRSCAVLFIGVLLVSGFGYLLFAYFFSFSIWYDLVLFFIQILFVEAISLLLSLYVVRQCGIRLVRSAR